MRFPKGAQSNVVPATATDLTNKAHTDRYNFYDIAGGFSGKYEANEVVLTFVAVRAVSIATQSANANGLHRAYAAVNPTAARTFLIKHNGTNVGSIVFNTNGSHTVAFTSAVSLVAGSRLTVHADGTVDNNLANVGFTLQGVIV
jgi:hypothetical protein